jgi:Domain of unknown function (DUF4382)
MRHIHPGASGCFALALASVLAAGCSNSDPASGKNGNVRFTMGGASAQAATLGATTPLALTDGDGRTIESAGITLSSILARNLDGELIDVTMDLPVDIDLVALINGRMVELPMGSLPAGSYDQLVVVIRSLHVVLSDGTRIDVTPPGGGWTAVVDVEPFDVVDGSVTTVHLRFRSEGAFRWVEGHLEFNPEFDCDVDDHRGDDDDDD